MYTNTIISALAMASIATATPVEIPQDSQTTPAINPFPITLAQFGYSHGNQIVALTPTRTTLGDSCNPNANATRTVVVRAQNSGYNSNPLCGHEFSLEGVTGLTLMCSDSAEHGEAASLVTAVATNGKQTHQCVDIPLNVYPMSCGAGTSIWQRYSCQ